MFCCVECKIRSKTSIQNALLALKPVIYCFRLKHHYQNGLLLLEILAYPSNKRVIYGPEGSAALLKRNSNTGVFL